MIDRNFCQLQSQGQLTARTETPHGEVNLLRQNFKTGFLFFGIYLASNYAAAGATHCDYVNAGYPTVDADRDGILNCGDNCPSHPNKNQEDRNKDGIGDVCEKDYRDLEKKGRKQLSKAWSDWVHTFAKAPVGELMRKSSAIVLAEIDWFRLGPVKDKLYLKIQKVTKGSILPQKVNPGLEIVIEVPSALPPQLQKGLFLRDHQNDQVIVFLLGGEYKADLPTYQLIDSRFGILPATKHFLKKIKTLAPNP